MRARRLCICIITIIGMLGLVGCSSKMNEMKDSASGTTTTMASQSYDTDNNGFYSDISYTSKEESQELMKPEATLDNFQKLIKRVNMELETLEYDSLLSYINEQMKAMNGYVEQSDTYNKGTYKNLRYTSMVLRIPSTCLDDFVTLVGYVK